MQTTVIQQLLEINNTFYQTFGKAFAITRRRVQPGIARCLAELEPVGSWLDLGCGGGSVAEAWANTPGRKGRYLGVDFSPVLLDEARKTVQGIQAEDISIDFCQGDLASMDWWHGLDDQIRSLRITRQSPDRFEVISAFAVLHHIPAAEIRRQILEKIHEHLKPNGLFILSVWQFQHSARLMARRLPWKTIYLSADQLEEGDALMDWRFSLPDQTEQVGLRYVHLFNRDELRGLASAAGFEILRTFELDGEGNRLGLYQVWKKRPVILSS
jgi:SAM-dependent methyltransferase